MKLIGVIRALALLAALVFGPLAEGAFAQSVFNADPATLGTIPDSFGECPNDGPPLLVAIPVTGGVGGVTSVSVSMTVRHTWMGEIVATLISPDGTQHLLYGHTRADDAGNIFWGSANDVDGTYTFNDSASGNWWSAALQLLVPPGAYRTSAIGGFQGATGAITSMNPVFNDTEPNGTWYVRFTDSCKLDIGVVTALSLSLTTNGVVGPPRRAVPDQYTAGRSTPLQIAAPGVLGNDVDAPGSGPLTATLQSSPSHGTVTLNSNGGFEYVPVTGYLGPDSFSYFPSNLAGPIGPTTVSINVVPVQPPVQLRVDRVVGNIVTLRWNAPPVGPRPTAYLVEGGVSPGSVQGSVSTGPAPAVTFVAPSGSFYVRVTAIDNEMSSGVSNEVLLHVNVPVAPSAPVSLTGLVNESSIALSWKLTYGGGQPSNVVLDVTGATTTSLSLPATEVFTFDGVPGGTYTLSVRAANSTGSSGSSTPITLTFPGGCSGVPAPPANYLFYNEGNVANVLWDPSPTGPAATSYVLNVTGAFVGQVPTGANRRLSQPVPPGSYTVSVSAVNACGSSAPTATQTIVVQ